MKNPIGTRIAEQRHLQNITQEKLADSANITVNYLSKVERGVIKNIGADTLYRIAHVLNVSMESLIEESISNNEELPQQRALDKASSSLPTTKQIAYCNIFLEIININK